MTRATTSEPARCVRAGFTEQILTSPSLPPPSLNFGDRCLPSDAQVPNNLRPGCWGIPWEMVIQASQATGKGVWINAPVSATVSWPANTSSYVYEWATLLRDGNAATGNTGIPDGAPIYIEHSNEVRRAAMVLPALPFSLTMSHLRLSPAEARSGTTVLVR